MLYRGLFIIDDKGVLRQITLNDLPVGRSVDETLRLVQAFQYTDKHGEGTLLLLFFFLNFIFLFDNVIYVFIMNLVFFIPHYPFIYFSHQNSSPFYQAPSYFCGFIGGDPLSLIRVACMNMTGGGVIFWIMGNLLVAISLKKMIPPIECFSEEWGLCSPPLIHERMLTCPVLYR